MKRTLPWIVGAVLLCAVPDAGAQKPAPRDLPSWHLQKIAKSSHAPDDEAPKGADNSPPKFLHLRIQLRPGVAEPKLHEFHVTDADGKPVAEAYGWYERNSLLVFEGVDRDWRDLRGLYLEGLGHREPLWEEPERPPEPPPPGPGPKPPRPKLLPKAPAPKSGPKPSAGVAMGLALARAACTGTCGAAGGGGQRACTARIGASTGITDVPPVPTLPPMVLYLSCGEETGAGKVYQVNERGLILGVVYLPQVATGLAFHRNRELVAVMPRDGGRLVRIGEGGKQNPILFKDRFLIHPVDVAIPANSDVIVVADDFRHALALTDIAGDKPRVCHSFKLADAERPSMSMAATLDGHVLYGSNKEPGVYRFSPADLAAARPPLLAEPGGVAADAQSLKWAATQGLNEIVVFAGAEPVKSVRLPLDTTLYANFYGNGLLAFGPRSSVVVATETSAGAAREVWFYLYDTRDDGLGKLFSWKREQLVDFLVGPPLLWPKDTPPSLNRKY